MAKTRSRALLIDTHILVWAATGDPRLRNRDYEAMVDPDNQIFVSAVVAFELADLQKRGRIKMTETLDFLQANMEFEIAAFPADCWQSAAQLPAIHRDPVDRMLIAHALHDDMTLVTADAYIRKYPVKLIG